jgi:hypothetical protein
MQFLKWLAIITVATILSFVLMIFLLGYGVTKGAEAIADAANEAVTQTVVTTGNGTTLYVPLHEAKGLRFDHVALCTPPEHQNDNFFHQVIAVDASSTSMACSNGVCTVTIGIPEHKTAPSSVFMYLRGSNGACEKKALSSQGHLTILGWKATIEFTDTLKHALGIAGDDYDISSSSSTGQMSWQLMGTKKVTLSYDIKPLSDLLIINGKPAAKIRFQ